MKQNTNNLIEDLRDIFVTTEVFNLRLSPIEKLVYGFTGAVLLAFIGGLIALVIRR